MTPNSRKIVVTGAGGQIAYSLLFRIASGALYGPEQDISLVLLDIPAAEDKVAGVAMELADGAFPRVRAIITTSDPLVAFEGADAVFLVGAKPRGKGQERSDLLRDNARIFEEQGKALNAVACPDVKILVVGNPANSNALIVARNAPRIPRKNITAMMRLDHNRAVSMLAAAADTGVEAVSGLAVWGNHSPTMVADISHVTINDKPVMSVLDPVWLRDIFGPRVADRGSEIIRARGASSAASAANAALDHMRDWIYGSDGRWVSFGIFGQGAYGFDEELVIGMPVVCEGGEYKVVDTSMSDYVRERVERSIEELSAEREALDTAA